MSDYTPTTESVRCAYIADWGWHSHDSGAAFDRWLAGVKAQAWQEGFCRGEVSGQREFPLNPYTENPYKEES